MAEHSSASNQPLDFLRRSADEAMSLDSLRACGALGRWQACQSAIANYHAPCIAQAKTFWGGAMEVDIREAVGSSIFIHGAYEPELSAFFSIIFSRGIPSWMWVLMWDTSANLLRTVLGRRGALWR
jgi:hypothetical protein